VVPLTQGSRSLPRPSREEAVTARGVVWDLCSGSGSATIAFEECGRHEVVRVDISGRPDVRADIRRLPLRGRPEFAWASPPCTEFSQLTFLRVYHPGGLPPNPELGMELVRAAFQDVQRADYWCVENVRRSEQFIAPEFGKPWLRKDAWCIWSNLPAPLESWGKWLKGRAARSKPTPSGLPRYRTGDRSKIPRELAEAVHRAVCEGT